MAAEAVPALLARGGIDRSHPRQAGKLSVAPEAPDTAGLADDLAGDERAAALERQQLRRVVSNRKRYLALELVDLV